MVQRISKGRNVIKAYLRLFAVQLSDPDARDAKARRASSAANELRLDRGKARRVARIDAFRLTETAGTKGVRSGKGIRTKIENSVIWRRWISGNGKQASQGI